MGILFNNNTWRRPLRLIDSWLPTTESRTPVRTVASPIPAFARAGWLAGSGRNERDGHSTAAMGGPLARPCQMRVVRAPEPGSTRRSDTRLVLSGPINDVCAELDRLAALEQRSRWLG